MRILRIAENEEEQVKELAELIMHTSDNECSLGSMLEWINSLSRHNSSESKFVVTAIVKKGKLELIITKTAGYALLSNTNFKHVENMKELIEWIIKKGVVLRNA